MTHSGADRPLVAFRVDSSAAIGSGHLRRCLTVAEVLRSWGRECLFLCRAGADTLNADVSRANFRLVELPAEPQPAEDAALCAAALAGVPMLEALVFDHYGLDVAAEHSLRGLARRIAVIDDLADRRHDCDLLIDVTPTAEPAARYRNLVPDNCRLLLGPAYAMLRPDFRRLRNEAILRDGSLRRLLVTFGAIDAQDCCGTAVDTARRVLGADVSIDVVVSRNAPHRKALLERAARDPRLEIHVDTPHMAELMRTADLAIGAGGTTSWERACLGLPALVAAIADNQRLSLAGLAAAGCVLAIDVDNLGRDIAAGLSVLGHSPGLLKSMGEAGRGLIDGRGAMRVARAICPPALLVREAEEDDSRNLWTWRNSDRVREASKCSEPIAWAAHQDWFAARLADPDSAILIASEAGNAAGVVRFDMASEEATISIYLVPDAHSRGLGEPLLRTAEAWLRANRPDVRRIVAEVLPHNRASVAAFEAANYEARLVWYERELNNE